MHYSVSIRSLCPPTVYNILALLFKGSQFLSLLISPPLRRLPVNDSDSS